MDVAVSERREIAPDQTVFRRRKPAMLVTLALFVAASAGVMQFRSPVSSFAMRPFGTFLKKSLPAATPSATAFGSSGGVLLRFAMPGENVEYPLDVHGDPALLSYNWVRVGDSTSAQAPRLLKGARVQAPLTPGFYRFALVRGDEHRVIEGLTLAVLVPFEEKHGTMLRGYRIGTYIGEQIAGRQDPPEGFLEIRERDVNLPISKHLKVSDFLNHDDQKMWPRYAAINPKLLDKIELVVSEITRWHGAGGRTRLSIDVKSGFRAPDHNARVKRAARDSQHQYGDAADVAIDANGDGKYSAMDSRMIGLAVEIVELKHPELVGGLGIYTSGHSRTTYVHIDARGKRARWGG
ncbi:MAG: D-Ala-D-Ala carboxypeptidase family metallohydrolase [Gemmatimonadaceae bacterium]